MVRPKEVGSSEHLSKLTAQAPHITCCPVQAIHTPAQCTSQHLRAEVYWACVHLLVSCTQASRAWRRSRHACGRHGCPVTQAHAQQQPGVCCQALLHWTTCMVTGTTGWNAEGQASDSLLAYLGAYTSCNTVNCVYHETWFLMPLKTKRSFLASCSWLPMYLLCGQDICQAAKQLV